MPKNADEKRIKILETAKRRFAHYGMAKTTMAEIAKDLSFSKALLYYYFPDKNSLYGAVLEYVVEELNKEVVDALERIDSTEQAVVMIIDKRMEFIKKYYYIIEFTFLNRHEVPPELEEVIMKTFEIHCMQIKNVLKKGVDSGELKEMDVDENSHIYMCATTGLRMMVMKDFKTDFMPTKEEFDFIASMQKKLAKIFIDGLRK